MPHARAADRPLTDAKRRALVRSGIGPMVYRLDAAAVAMIPADCAALDLDARATMSRAAAWASACRRALDAGEPLPESREAPAAAVAAAAARRAAALASPDDGAELDMTAGAA